jgi:hypothetical protein
MLKTQELLPQSRGYSFERHPRFSAASDVALMKVFLASKRKNEDQANNLFIGTTFPLFSVS